MKRGIIIISMFLVLIGCCVGEELLLKNNLNKLQEKTYELKTLVDNSTDVNTEEVTTKIEDLEKFWNKTEGYFCIVVNHINMEEAGEQISKIKTLSKTNKKDELLVEIDLLIYYSNSYEHLLVPNIQNIL